jgi:hypothetical protein
MEILTTLGKVLFTLLLIFVSLLGCTLMAVGCVGFFFSAHQAIRRFADWDETIFGLSFSAGAFLIGYLAIYALCTLTG